MLKARKSEVIEMLIKNFQTKIDARLDILLSETGQPYDDVVRAARYSIIDGGKRIRPFILTEFYRLCGGDDDCAMNFAAALEMIHTYSLIHDDLPCMDNDDMRRGKPSSHKQFGEAVALLAGDTLLTEAFNVASKTIGISPERIVPALNVLAECAGVAGMIGGQMIDINSDNNELSTDLRLEMYRLKTGALIKAAAKIGAILAGASKEEIINAEAFGENLGIAFQIVDDILDATSDIETLGKPVGSDDKNGKITFVSILGLEKCEALAAEYSNKALSALNTFEEDKENLIALTEYLLKRKN